MDRFVDFLNNFVVPLFDNSGQVYIAYDDFIPENMDVKLREIEIALNRQPYMTINEVRASKGLPKITGGDTVYGNPFAAPIGEPVESKETHEHVHKDVHETMAEKALDLINKVNPNNEKAEKDKMAHKAFVSRVEAYQKQTASKIRDFNNKQKTEVLQNLGRATKAVSKGDLFDVDGQVGVMIDIVSPILRGLLTEQIMEEWIEQGFDGQVDTSKESLTKIIERSAKRLAKSYNDSTAQLLKRTLNDGINEGEGIDKLTKRVEQVYDYSDSYRAPMVAHTETFFVANEASKEAYRQSGVVKTIRWYTADSDACEFCQPLNGEEIGIDENFYDKGDTVVGANGGKLTMDYRTLDVPPIHPNCRCFIRPEEISV
jgi:SPP1 gp7 family putative phage head morphogenesis protein